MEKLMTWALRHPGAVLLPVLLITILAATRLQQLQVAISPQSLIIEGGSDQRFYRNAQQEFGSDGITIVYVQDRELFEPGRMQAIRALSNRLEALPFVTRTQSLFNVPRLQVHDEAVSTESYLHRLPQDPAEAEQLIEAALKNPFVRRNLLSQDGRVLAINLYIDARGYAQNPAYDGNIAAAVDRAIAPVTGQVEHVFQIGLPYVRSELAKAVSQQQTQLIAVAFGVLLTVLLLVFRYAGALIVPLATSTTSVIWLLGAMAVLEIPLTVLTAIVPVLMIIIGSTEDVHLLAEYYRHSDRGQQRLRAIRTMNRRMGLAIGLTFLTSCLGFLAVAANPIGLVRNFGLVASAGLALNFLLTALLVPPLLHILGEQGSRHRDSWLSRAYAQVSLLITHFILQYRRSCLGVVALLALTGLLAIERVQVNNSVLNYVEPDSPIRDRIVQLREHLAGPYTLQVVLDGHIDGAFERVRYLEDIHAIQAYLERAPGFDNSLSIADYLAVLNSAVNETGDPELPEEDDVAQTLMLFVGREAAAGYLSEDHSRANILVRHSIADSRKLEGALGGLRGFIREHIDPDLKVTITGESVLTDNAISYLVDGQIRSLALIVISVLAITALLFLTVKAGLIAAAVALFPIIILFGVMGVAGIPLDSATSMIAAIAVGVGIDHFLHFMVRYHHYQQRGIGRLEAVSNTIANEAGAIGTAALALGAGFATLMLSDFPPIYDFGLLSAITMLSTFVAALFLAPILLSYVPMTTLWDVLGMHLRRELTQDCPLFQQMGGLQVRRIILLGRQLRFSDGATIMQAGEKGDSLYVLLRGQVAIDSPGDNGGQATLKIAQPGEIFGLGALMCDQPRVATATAIESAEVLALNWEQLQRIARRYPRTAYLLFRNLSILISRRFTERNRSALVPAQAFSGKQWLSRDKGVCSNSP